MSISTAVAEIAGIWRFQLLLVVASLTACSSIREQSLKGQSSVFFPTGLVNAETSIDSRIVGDRLMEAGEHELALKAYLRAAAEYGLTADILTSLGSANLKLGRIGQAESQLRQAILKDNTFTSAWNNLGVVLIERNDTDEAVRVFRTAFALDRGKSDLIAKNLQRALAQATQPNYSAPKKPSGFELVRSEPGSYKLSGI